MDDATLQIIIRCALVLTVSWLIYGVCCAVIKIISKRDD